MQKLFENYIQSISLKFAHEETSEMGYRTDFEILLKGIFESINVKRIDHDPRAKQQHELTQTYRAVFAAACFARVQPWSQHGDARLSWVRHIDVLRAKYNAGMAFASNDLQDLGVDRVRLVAGELPAVLVDWSGIG
jgi:hypothetical protein